MGGDVITEVDGEAIGSNSDLYKLLETKKRVGETVTVTFYRGDEILTAEVVLTESPD